MGDILFSLVVTAFNVEDFIERCLASIREQSPLDCFEVLVVDDGSTDRTGQILQDLAVREAGLRVFRQANQGVGAARNLGIEQARGRYIWFVDGDDFLKNGAIQRLRDALVGASPDVVAIDFSCADEAGHPVDWISSPFSGNRIESMRGAQFFSRYFDTTFTCMYVIKRAILVDHGLRFQPRIKMQDAELIPRILAVAEEVLIPRIDAYVYVKRAGSYMNNSSTAAREESFRSVLEVHRRLQAFREGVRDRDMRAGLASKLNSIRRILLMAFVYDHLDQAALRRRLDLLKSEGLHPFEPIAGETIKTRLLRTAVNLGPMLFPAMYRVVRRALNTFRRPGNIQSGVRS